MKCAFKNCVSEVSASTNLFCDPHMEARRQEIFNPQGFTTCAAVRCGRPTISRRHAYCGEHNPPLREAVRHEPERYCDCTGGCNGLDCPARPKSSR